MSEVDNTMISGIFTATVKSLKVLQNMQQKQTDVMDAVTAISKEQKEHLTILNDIRTQPEPEILEDIKDIVTAMTKSMAEIDLDSIVKSINAHTTTTTRETDKNLSREIKLSQQSVSTDLSNQHTQVIDTVNKRANEITDELKTIDKNSADAHAQEINELKDIKKSSNLEALRKLIDGLKNQQDNMNKLASYIQVLSENVQNGRKETTVLAQAIQESGSRIKSMDFRLAAVTNDKISDVDDISQSLELLESISNNENPDIALPDLTTTHNMDELNDLVTQLEAD